jgi:hypothetical protein
MILLQPSTIGINYVGYKEFFSEKGENLRSFGERRIKLDSDDAPSGPAVLVVPPTHV